MASVAVPMITSKAIGMVGEKMGLDPRLTAIASMAGGFGAGQAYTSFGNMNAANAATGAANKAASAANGYGLGKNAMAKANINMFGPVSPATGGDHLLNAFNQTGVNISGEGSNFLDAVDQPYLDATGNVLQGRSAGPNYKMQPIKGPTTFKDQFGQDIDKWKSRPVDDEGNETGLSPFENLGSEMLGTLMQDLPEEPRQQHQGGGGGGGGSAGAYQGGGSGSYKALDWFPNKEGFKPQGI